LTSTSTTADRARRFHALHAGPDLLLLANAWDAGSARLVVAQGGTAIATSSAAVAWAQGFPDGDALPTARLLQMVEAIVDAVDVPFTVDFESGYSDDPAAVARLAGELMARGVVGINIEDGAGEPALLARKIAAIRAEAARAGIDLFINARTDVWLRGLVAPEARATEALRRAALYREAGASGLFAAGVTTREDIAVVVQGTPLPVNVLARATLPDLATLRTLGVRRLSAGSAIAEQLGGVTACLARRFLQDGRVDPTGATALTYGDLNAVMKRG
jgi:2-methylisocitrate lyase-like PEP mutase family enzyme